MDCPLVIAANAVALNLIGSPDWQLGLKSGPERNVSC